MPYFTRLDRWDGRIEAICEHGVGHTIFAPKKKGNTGFIHGCDSCCDSVKLTPEIIKLLLAAKKNLAVIDC